MSSVTNLILILGMGESSYPNNHQPLQKLNDHLRQNKGVEFCRVDEHAGGDKGFESEVYMAAINYLHIKDLLAVFKTCQWTYTKDVMLLYKLDLEVQYAICVPPGVSVKVNKILE